MRKWQNVALVSRIELEKSFLNDCHEAPVDYVGGWIWRALLDFAGENLFHEEYNGHHGFDDSNPHHKESESNEQDSAEEMGEFQPPRSRFAPARSTPICFPDV